jgi:Flp pilus assembly protein TadD
MRIPSLAIVALGLALGGCKSLPDTMTTGSLGSSSSASTVATDAAGWRTVADQWRPVYEKTPTDARAASIYGRALRQLGQRSQAVAVLQTAAIKNDSNMVLLGEYGRALAENGDLTAALDVLSRAHTPDKPDWRILSAQGAVLDQMGRNGEARKMYDNALKIMPDEPSILSNLGLSYALTNELALAESTLRRAYANPAADMRVRQNLALVLALQGKFDEAKQVATRDLSPAEAEQNIAALRSMVAQPNSWQKLKQLDRRPAKAG